MAQKNAKSNLTWFHRQLLEICKSGGVPEHVAFVMDGNRRFARTHNLDNVVLGHEKGFESLLYALEVCLFLGIKIVTVYAFSEENFSRPREEVDGLMRIAIEKFGEFLDVEETVMREGVVVDMWGRPEILPPKVRAAAARVILGTKDNPGKARLNVCFAYSGTEEIAIPCGFGMDWETETDSNYSLQWHTRLRLDLLLNSNNGFCHCLWRERKRKYVSKYSKIFAKSHRSQSKNRIWTQFYKKPLRPDYEGGYFAAYKSSGKTPKLTDEARLNLVLDSKFVELTLEKNKIRSESDRETKRVKTSTEDDSSSDEEKLPFKLRSDQGQLLGANRILADHYGVSAEAVRRIVNEAEESGRYQSKKHLGRPKQLTPTKRKKIVEVINKKKFRTTLKRVSKTLEGQTNWKTIRKGKESTAPSSATLSRALNDGSWRIGMVRKRPLIEGNELAIAERKVFPVEAKTWDDTKVYMHDEAYCQPRQKLGRFIVDLNARPDDARDELEEDEPVRPVEFDSGGKHEPKIFMFGAVTMPRTLMIDGQKYIHPLFDGKVYLANVRGFRKRKKNTKHGQKGEKIFESVTINGDRYKKIFEMEGGYLNAIKQYEKPELRPPDYCTARVALIDLDEEERIANGGTAPASRWDRPVIPTSIIIQEDGAPGHGFDNRNNRGSQTHDDLKHNCQTLGIQLVKQSRHSPEINNLDLGVWRVIKTGIENEADEIAEWTGSNGNQIEADTWKIAKKVWLELDPRKLYLIGMQRRVLLDAMIAAEGKSIRVEPHTGLRKNNPIYHDPEFVMHYLAAQNASSSS